MLAEAIVALKERVRLCSRCFSITEDDPCEICRDPRRDGSMFCVVAEAKDIYALERTSAYNGRYHVLGGLISPMDGIGPGQLRVKELIDRIASEGPGEVIVATNPNAEGEATALYLRSLIAPSGVNVTRLAYGLPIGGDLDYADEVTLTKALEGRSACPNQALCHRRTNPRAILEWRERAIDRGDQRGSRDGRCARRVGTRRGVL